MADEKAMKTLDRFEKKWTFSRLVKLGTIQLAFLCLLHTSGLLTVHLPPYLASGRFPWWRSSDYPQLQWYSCRPPLPTLFSTSPPTSDILNKSSAFRSMKSSLNSYLKKRASAAEIDSIVVGVVTSEGIVYESALGVRKANETGVDNRGVVDKDTIYRVASISKMFAVLETLILRERGALNLDDPVTKFLPDFSHPKMGWKESLVIGSNKTRGSASSSSIITLRQLATHMSGLGRQHPYPSTEQWPQHDVNTTGYALPITRAEVEKSIAQIPLINRPYEFPVYSNTGFSVLGWCNVAADIPPLQGQAPARSYAEQLSRDVFVPLGMNATSFMLTEETAPVVAVPSANLLPGEADLDFGEGWNAAGGQYSSLADLAKFMQTVLDPTRPESLLPPAVVREWLRPLYGWSDFFTEAGAPWEIINLRDSNRREVRHYTKAGDLRGYHSLFSINPDSGYGVIMLLTGSYYAKRDEMFIEIVNRIQPAFDQLLAVDVESRYGGTWVSEGSDHRLPSTSQAIVTVYQGSLWVERLVINGTDVIAKLQKGAQQHVAIPLWSTGNEDEFRLAWGAPGFNELPFVGCSTFWTGLDGFMSNGFPADLIVFEGDSKSGVRRLHYPAAGATLIRASEAAR